jgi:hypothetical protein
MKVISTLYAQAIRFGTLRPSKGNSLYGINLVRAFEERYGFLESPKTVADFDVSKGITFLHGFFEDKVVIEKAMLYNNGILIETKSTTDDCINIIADIVVWANQNASFIFEEDHSSPKMYLSHFEVEAGVNLQRISDKFQLLSDEINRYMISYGEVGRDYKFSSLAFQLDPTSASPMPYKFERRAHQPFGSNLYFSSAPLKTEDHLALLNSLERLFIS